MGAPHLPFEREHVVRCVPELVRERRDVAQPVGEVQQHVREDPRRHRRAVSAGCLARTRRRVHVTGVEDPAEDLCEARREPPERGVDDLDGLRPREGTRVAEGRVLVGELEPLESEQLRLRPKPPPPDVVALLCGAHHRLDRLAVELVAHVRRLHRVGEAAQPVESEAIADECVVAGREHVPSRLEPLEKRRLRGKSESAFGAVEIREQRADRVRLLALAGVERDLERRDLAVVEGLPGRDGRPPGVQRLLLRFAPHVRLLLALDPELVRERCKLGRREQRLRGLVVQGDPLESEEDERVLDLRPTVARDGREVVRLRVGRVHAEAQVRVDRKPRKLLLELVCLVEERAQLDRVEPGDAAAIPGRELRRALTELRPLRAGLGGARRKSERTQRTSSARSSTPVTGGLFSPRNTRSAPAGRRVPAAGCPPRAAGLRRRCRASRPRTCSRTPAPARTARR